MVLSKGNAIDLYITLCCQNVPMQSDLIAWPIFKQSRCLSLLRWFLFGSLPLWWPRNISWLRLKPKAQKPDLNSASSGFATFRAIGRNSPPPQSQLKSVPRNLCSNQTLSVGDYVAPLLLQRDPVCRSGPGEPSLFLKTNVYNRLGASVEGIQETLAYVCLRFEDCG